LFVCLSGSLECLSLVRGGSGIPLLLLIRFVFLAPLLSLARVSFLVKRGLQYNIVVNNSSLRRELPLMLLSLTGLVIPSAPYSIIHCLTTLSLSQGRDGTSRSYVKMGSCLDPCFCYCDSFSPNTFNPARLPLRGVPLLLNVLEYELLCSESKLAR
jgi:hypothetical protein